MRNVSVVNNPDLGLILLVTYHPGQNETIIFPGNLPKENLIAVVKSIIAKIEKLSVKNVFTGGEQVPLSDIKRHYQHVANARQLLDCIFPSLNNINTSPSFHVEYHSLEKAINGYDYAELREQCEEQKPQPKLEAEPQPKEQVATPKNENPEEESAEVTTQASAFALVKRKLSVDILRSGKRKEILKTIFDQLKPDMKVVDGKSVWQGTFSTPIQKISGNPALDSMLSNDAFPVVAIVKYSTIDGSSGWYVQSVASSAVYYFDENLTDTVEKVLDIAISNWK